MQINKFSGGWSLLVCLVACSANEGGPKQVAGGQSGTDSQGAYTCVLDSPIVESIPLDQVPLGSVCSPNAEFEKLEGSQVFQCKEQEVAFTVNVTRGSSARRLTGKLYSDTDRAAPPTDCNAMSLDASLEIRASDSSVDFAGAATLTVDHLCSSATIAEKVQGAEGEFRFELNQENLFVVFPTLQTELCSPTIQASIHGNGSSGAGIE
jgi:hypothetical protein